jgi:hypothetical protein
MTMTVHEKAKPTTSTSWTRPPVSAKPLWISACMNHDVDTPSLVHIDKEISSRESTLSEDEFPVSRGGGGGSSQPEPEPKHERGPDVPVETRIGGDHETDADADAEDTEDLTPWWSNQGRGWILLAQGILLILILAAIGAALWSMYETSMLIRERERDRDRDHEYSHHSQSRAWSRTRDE